MQQPLVVVINDAAHLEYDRSKPLPEAQLRYLERMDRDMGAGIAIGGEHFANPERAQCARFVALTLIDALQGDNDPLAAACCAWLATRLPELRQVQAIVQEDAAAVDLVFDKPYVKEQKMQFVKLESLKRTHESQ